MHALVGFALEQLLYGIVFRHANLSGGDAAEPIAGHADDEDAEAALRCSIGAHDAARAMTVGILSNGRAAVEDVRRRLIA